MKDYSQNKEQAAILTALYGTDSPDESTYRLPRRRFIDIGAYHPFVFSNTRALWELGWEGLMIEPSPGCMKALATEYHGKEHITLIQACASLHSGLIEMNITDDAVSTRDAHQYEQWKEVGGYYGKILVPAITLEEIFNQFGSFDFWNIDAEGHSVDLFIEMLRCEQRPLCVCLEMDHGRDREANALATHHGYKIVYANDTNVVYAK